MDLKGLNKLESVGTEPGSELETALGKFDGWETKGMDWKCSGLDWTGLVALCRIAVGLCSSTNL